MPDRSPRPLPYRSLLPAVAGGDERGPVLPREAALSRDPLPRGGRVALREGDDVPSGSGDPDRAADSRGRWRGRGTGRSGSQPQGGESNNTPEDTNPFAPPPEDAPDRPWQPRGEQGQDDGDGGRDPWPRWSGRQPGPSQGNGPFGDRPRRPGGTENGRRSRPGWDPRDPAQRRARYALLFGMWGFFFALFDWPFRSAFFAFVSLLLASLALYWGISTLRNTGARRATGGTSSTTSASSEGRGTGADDDTAGSTGTAPDSGPVRGMVRSPADTASAARPAGPATDALRRQQRTAAISGLVTAGLAVCLMAGAFAVRLAYSDFYTCTQDALTLEASQSCERHLPENLREVLGNQE